MDITKWTENANSMINKGEAGKCPYCESNNTDYKIGTVANKMGYADVWCNDCKKAIHF